MTFLWPTSLYLLGAIPILIAVYIWMLRRRGRFAVRYSSLSLVRQALPPRANARRHIPFGLFLLALSSLVLALGRPVSAVGKPTELTTVLLSLDVSGSMCLTDIQPSRLLAAEAAALKFIERPKASTYIGVVAFSGAAELVQAPTTDLERLQSAIAGLEVASTTAIGSAILKSLDAIAEIDPNVAPSQDGQASPGAGLSPASGPAPDEAYAPDIIILLTDGVSNNGPDPLAAAQQAADRGVRVYTIGFGTADGVLHPECPSQLPGSEAKDAGNLVTHPVGPNHGPIGEFLDQELLARPYVAGAASAGNSGFPRGIDEETLQKIASMTGGEYYPAESASELEHVFKELPTYSIMRRATVEVSVAFAAIGAFFTALAVILSMLWQPL